ncbi:LysR family transcriptional regulator [Castellaniella defragrans]|uniref:LysR family nod box-dependent transcriptional activator n=1 Tax=Castellaniella defragrans TaxID=75697 RepID=A0A7W9TRH2_CASDE|nr:LysR family transcriptional regulator [Castellaniella defragrans]KAB0622259.1 LysR family transcriptional regulator [Castellaniella defragrans]MBB6084212.1 LysR family nod box-dependent transcriptional activator [Castellaniella defragrans]
MRFNRLDLNLLVVLDALLTERNITRAGEKIFLSQSATSGALGRLREFFSDELLVQVGRKMVLTPLGESLVRPVRATLIQIQTTIDMRPEFDPAVAERKFTLVMSDYTSTVLMPDVIRAASRDAPGISFEILTPSDDPLEQLERGEADFVLLPDHFIAQGHPSCHVFTEDFVCVCWEGNPMVGETLSARQYLDMGHVMVRFGSQLNPSLDESLTKKSGIERKAEVVSTTYAAIPHYVIGTNRIATLQRRLAYLWAHYMPLRILPLPVHLPKAGWSLQWHQYRDMDPATQWMRRLIVGVAGARPSLERRFDETA